MEQTPSESVLFSNNIDESRNLQESLRGCQDSHQIRKTYVMPRALITMMFHSIKGANEKPPKEIFGFLYGRMLSKEKVFVSSVFATNVIGSETEVVSTDEALMDESTFRMIAPKYGHEDLIVGWYHSHPGLFCFFSRIDVLTNRNMQMAFGGFEGLVIDPCNTISSGRLHLGSYVTKMDDDFETPIPEDVMSKYGNDANNYYEVEIQYLTTDTDKKIISEIIQKTFGASISCKQLKVNESYISKSIEDISPTIKKIGTNDERNSDIGTILTRIQAINDNIQTNLVLHKMNSLLFD